MRHPRLPSTDGRLGRPRFGRPGRRDPQRRTLRVREVRLSRRQRSVNPAALNPDLDPHIVDQAATRGSGIFGQAEYHADGEFRKAAAVMKMVIDG